MNASHVVVATAVLALFPLSGNASIVPVTRGARSALGTNASRMPGTWKLVPTSNRGTIHGGKSVNSLNAVAAVSSSDVWAVGAHPSDRRFLETLTEHWDGSRWTIVPSPNGSGTTSSVLTGVAAVSTNDVWAVGYDSPPTGNDTVLIEHWDGAAWRAVPGPNLGSEIADLFAVTAVSKSDVWAVGWYWSGLTLSALTIHWDGTKWRNVYTGLGNSDSNLFGVTKLRANDVWAAGNAMLNWTGGTWNIIPVQVPLISGAYVQFKGVSASAPDNVWAAGFYGYPSGSSYQYGPLVERWDGTSWKIVPDKSMNGAYAVSALAENDVWVVGAYGYQGLVEHWDGRTFGLIPHPAARNGAFLGISALSPTDLWAVGVTGNGKTLAEHYTVP